MSDSFVIREGFNTILLYRDFELPRFMLKYPVFSFYPSLFVTLNDVYVNYGNIFEKIFNYNFMNAYI